MIGPAKSYKQTSSDDVPSTENNKGLTFAYILLIPVFVALTLVFAVVWFYSSRELMRAFVADEFSIGTFLGYAGLGIVTMPLTLLCGYVAWTMTTQFITTRKKRKEGDDGKSSDTSGSEVS